MIQDFVKLVGEFHDAFEVDRKNVDWGLRDRLLDEEINELKNATSFENEAKELVDVFYILCGSLDLCRDDEVKEDIKRMTHKYIFRAVEMGVYDCLPELFAEVHRSNMSKLENGKVLRREDGKILKGKNYKEADIKSILEKHNKNGNK